MWLINTESLRLEFVLSPDTHSYAILSHTWEDEEVTFQDMIDPDYSFLSRKSGYSKIEHTCSLAKRQGLPYAWVDTCCINKESSAELTEAINSMFTWYQKSAICFVYLSDFPAHEPEFPDPLLPTCRWFTRGWTLQELLAPRHLNLYDCAWNDHGRKRLRSLEISEITGIHLTDLENSGSLRSIPVGRKMSWVAQRRTTRPEDLAYCLLGIFDVNMSLIYGEGPKAFMRLQEAILNRSSDMTLFAWTCQKSGKDNTGYRGILARSPIEFLHCRNITRDSHIDINREFALTTSRIRIHANLAKGPEDDHVLFVGSSLVDNGLETRRVGIYLRKTPAGFYRYKSKSLFFSQSNNARSVSSTGPSSIQIPKDVAVEDAWRVEARQGFVRLTFNFAKHLYLASIRVKPSNIWDSHRLGFLTQTGLSYIAVCRIHLINTLTGKPLRFSIACEIQSSMQIVERPIVVWALVCSANDKPSSPCRNLHKFLDEYLGAGGAGNDNDTRSVSPELANLCTQRAVQAPTPQIAHLETRRGVRTGIVLEIWPGELVVAFPTSPWYRRGKRWNGLELRSGIVAIAVQITRKLTRSTTGSDNSQDWYGTKNKSRPGRESLVEESVGCCSS